MASLSPEQVADLRHCFRKRMGVSDTARELGITKSVVSKRFRAFRGAKASAVTQPGLIIRPISLPRLKYMEGANG